MMNLIDSLSAIRCSIAAFAYPFAAFFSTLILAGPSICQGHRAAAGRAFAPTSRAANQEAIYRPIEIFPLVKEHVHAPAIVELPNGNLLAAWYQGSGERRADDVAIMGARLPAAQYNWSKPFVMADVPGFPDVNPILFIDPQGRLWLMWYAVIANQWETSLLKYRISEDYLMGSRRAGSLHDGPPKWGWQDVLLVKPGDSTGDGIQPDDRFVKSVERQIEQYARYIHQRDGALEKEAASRLNARWEQWADQILAKARGQDMMRRGYLVDSAGRRTEKMMGYPYFQRMGWQTKNKAVIVEPSRIIVPLYSDGFSFSLMAVTDDGGNTWQFSEPLVGPGNIQPAIAQKADGTLVAYMRDNGPPPQRLHISSSKDKGLVWSPVRDSELPNPGSGADLVTLRNGHWVLAYNDTEDGRHSLAISISTNEGKTWQYTRHLERDTRARDIATRSHYPSIIQSHDGTIHVVYSYHHSDRGGGPNKTIKYVQFNETWVRLGR